MPSRVDPRSGPFPVYSSASPPTIDVGVFIIAKTGVNLKAAATTTIFTVPTGRTFIATYGFALVTAVTSGGAGTQLFSINESSSLRSMLAALTSGSTTPVANQTVYSFDVRASSAPFSTCLAGNSVQVVVSTSQAGSSAVTGTIYVAGFYSS